MGPAHVQHSNCTQLLHTGKRSQALKHIQVLSVLSFLSSSHHGTARAAAIAGRSSQQQQLAMPAKPLLIYKPAHKPLRLGGMQQWQCFWNTAAAQQLRRVGSPQPTAMQHRSTCCLWSHSWAAPSTLTIAAAAPARTTAAAGVDPHAICRNISLSWSAFQLQQQLLSWPLCKCPRQLQQHTQHALQQQLPQQ